MQHPYLPRTLPAELEILVEFALDLRWIWSHAGDALWQTIAPEIWERTQNPWMLLQNVSKDRLDALVQDQTFLSKLEELKQERIQYYKQDGWFQCEYPDCQLGTVAYFSMEYGLGEALPIYAGGLGILAGDLLKSASDLNLPLVGIAFCINRVTLGNCLMHKVFSRLFILIMNRPACLSGPHWTSRAIA